MNGNNGVTFCEPEEEIFAEKIDVRIAGARPGTTISGSFTVYFRRLDAADFYGRVQKFREIAKREQEGEDVFTDLVQYKQDVLKDVMVSVEGIGNSQGVYSPEDQIAVVQSKLHYLNPAFERFLKGHQEAPTGNSKPSPRR